MNYVTVSLFLVELSGFWMRGEDLTVADISLLITRADGYLSYSIKLEPRGLPAPLLDW